MNEQTHKKNNKFQLLLKNYSHYFILGGLALLMVAIMIIASLTGDAKINNGELDVETSSNLSFNLPVLNASIVKAYNENDYQYNEVLNKWEIYKAIQFAAEEGTNVLASCAGTVTNVYTNQLEGTVVVIDHGNDIKTVYGSLASGVNVEIGDTVNGGDVIGTASNSGIGQSEDSHVHFEVWKEASLVDPAAYLNIESK